MKPQITGNDKLILVLIAVLIIIGMTIDDNSQLQTVTKDDAFQRYIEGVSWGRHYGERR